MGCVCAFFVDLYANQIAVYLLWIWNLFKRHVFTYVLCAFIPTSNSMFRVNSFSILLYLSLSVYISFFVSTLSHPTIFYYHIIHPVNLNFSTRYFDFSVACANWPLILFNHLKLFHCRIRIFFFSQINKFDSMVTEIRLGPTFYYFFLEKKTCGLLLCKQ